MNNAGLIIDYIGILCFSFRKNREMNRQIIGNDSFIAVYVAISLLYLHDFTNAHLSGVQGQDSWSQQG